jgi:histidine kinase
MAVFRSERIELATNGLDCQLSSPTYNFSSHHKGELEDALEYTSQNNNRLPDCNVISINNHLFQDSHESNEFSNIFSECHLRIDHDENQQQLLQAFDRSLPTSIVSEITLITGSSGTGKSTFAAILKKMVESKHGFFLLGKFKNKRFGSPPFLPFLCACSNFVMQILQKRDYSDQMADFKTELTNTFELHDFRLLCDLVPELQLLFEKDINEDIDRKKMDDSTTMYTERHRRLTTILLNLLRVISNSKIPIILVLDDLQWSDSLSLELLKTIVLEMTKNAGLMIVGICTIDKITIDHRVSIFLRDLENNQVAINEVKVPKLKDGVIKEYLCSALDLSDDECMILSKAANKISEGNIYFLKHFLNSLVDKSILAKNETRHWSLNIVQFQMYIDKINIFDILAQRVID